EDAAQTITDTTPVFRKLLIKNLSATCSRDAGIIVGLPESPISGVVLENVNISAAGSGLVIRNAKGVQLKNVQVKAGKGRPIMIENAQVKGAEALNGHQQE